MFEEIPYHKPRTDGCKVYSVDMCRYKFKCHYDTEYRTEEGTLVKVPGVAALVDMLQYLQLQPGHWTVKHYDSFKEYGGYRHLYVVQHESWDSSVSIGLQPSVKNGDKLRGFIEYNPNKVKGAAWERLKVNMQLCFESLELSRYDLAVDFLCPRQLCRLDAGGARSYELYYEHGSYTEYTGQRSAVGRVKLYDKTAELRSKDIDCPDGYSRVEYTLDLAADPRELPGARMSERQLHFVETGELAPDVNTTTLALVDACVLLDAPSRNRILKRLDARQRKKAEALLQEAPLPLDSQILSGIRQELTLAVLY